ncbi:MAG: AbrB/MazE/SpoVT family DNA-binding domain-containing protein [Thaumarchaeota archaeon]|nr:AbrB/MazE/SpoVT family DNA-binding domain-containing protein [Nitrososphaerota archaeon]
MLEEEMKVGPKGQVVIPKTLRKVLKIHPGSKVTFRLEEDKVIIHKSQLDTVTVLEKIAKKGRSIKPDPHLYEEELAGRAKQNALP